MGNGQIIRDVASWLISNQLSSRVRVTLVFGASGSGLSGLAWRVAGEILHANLVETTPILVRLPSDRVLPIDPWDCVHESLTASGAADAMAEVRGESRRGRIVYLLDNGSVENILRPSLREFVRALADGGSSVVLFARNSEWDSRGLGFGGRRVGNLYEHLDMDMTRIELQEWDALDVNAALEKSWGANWRYYWLHLFENAPDVFELIRKPQFRELVIRQAPELVRSGQPLTLRTLAGNYCDTMTDRLARILNCSAPRAEELAQAVGYVNSTMEPMADVHQVLRERQWRDEDLRLLSENNLAGIFSLTASGELAVEDAIYDAWLRTKAIESALVDDDLLPLRQSLLKPLVLRLLDQGEVLAEERLLSLVAMTRRRGFETAGYVGSNAFSLAALQRLDWSERNFEYSFAPSASLAGLQLRGTSLRYANLRDAAIGGCDLTHADLRHADLNGTDFSFPGRNGSLAVDAMTGAIAAGDDFGSVSLWDSADDWPHVLDLHSKPIWALSLKSSPTGLTMLSGSHDGFVHMCREVSGQRALRPLWSRQFDDWILSVDISPPLAIGLVSTSSGIVSVVDLEDGAQLAQVGLPLEVHAARFSPDGDRVALATPRNVPCVVQVRESTVDDGTWLGDTTTGPALWSVSWSSTGDRLAAADDGGTVWLYGPDGVDKKRISRSPLLSVAWSPDDQRLAVSSASGMLWILDTDSLETISTIGVSRKKCWHALWLTGSNLVVVSDDGRVRGCELDSLSVRELRSDFQLRGCDLRFSLGLDSASRTRLASFGARVE
jgi:hypothetical protein